MGGQGLAPGCGTVGLRPEETTGPQGARCTGFWEKRRQAELAGEWSPSDAHTDAPDPVRPPSPTANGAIADVTVLRVGRRGCYPG